MQILTNFGMEDFFVWEWGLGELVFVEKTWMLKKQGVGEVGGRIYSYYSCD